MKILVTGAAGFIGAAVVRRLLTDDLSNEVVGLDNINDYYDPALKFGRLAGCGIDVACSREEFPWYKFINGRTIGLSA